MKHILSLLAARILIRLLSRGTILAHRVLVLAPFFIQALDEVLAHAGMNLGLE